MKKRCISLLLVLLMALTLLPAEALALLGGSVGNLREVIQPVTIKKEGVDDGSQLYSMKMNNGKLVMFIATSGPHMGKSVTTSDRGYTATMDSIRKGVYEKASFTFSGKSIRFGINKALTIRSMEVVDPEKTPELAAFGTAIPTENALVIRYTFDGDNPKVMCFISYYFVELAPGVAKGTLTNETQTEDGKTYALAAQAFWCPDVMTDNFDWFVFQWNQEYHGFSRMGHAAAERAAHVKVSRTYESGETTTAKETDITAGMGRVRTGASFFNGAVAEIYSDSYGVDNPFVLVDNENVRRNEAEAPAFVRYDAEKDVLTAWGYTEKLSPSPEHSFFGSAFHIWGYRNVYTKAEAAEQSKVNFTRPDEVIIPQDSDKLGIYKSGGSMLAISITDTAREQVLKRQHGAPLYTLRGDFKEGRDDGGKFYEFTSGKVALTPTVTATWNSGQHFKVRVDGNGRFTRFDTSAGVEYNTPTFKLYSPVTGMTEAAGLDFDGGEELTLHMKPDKNAVLVFVNIPQVSSHIDKAQLKGSGDVVLSGQMGLDLILNCAADQLITLEKLSYGPKGSNNEFQQNGILANGKISSADLLGLELGELEAAINTFDGQEQYDFKLELNAFDLFETKAELQLKRLNNGRLAPNNLYFRFATAGGIPIVPPVPTTFIKGGGGGFYGLADTIKGDFVGIPPIRLKLSIKADYVKVIEGWANATVGPGILEYEGENMTIAKMPFLRTFGMRLKLEGEKRRYLSTTYTGLRAGGGMNIKLEAPKEPYAFFEVEGSAEASVFGGLDSYKNPTSAYIQLDSRGKINATVKIPERLGKVRFRILKGKKLFNTQVDFILGTQTAMNVAKGTPFKDAVTSAWNNMSVYGGVSNHGKFLASYYRIYYVIPNHFGGGFHLWKNINAGWSLEKEIAMNGWYPSGSRGLQAAAAPMTVMMAPLYDGETEEQVGIAVVETSLYAVSADSVAMMAVALPGGEGFEQEIEYKKVASGTSGPSSESDLGLMVMPENAADLDKLRNSMKLYEVAEDTSLTPITLTEMKDDGKENINIETLTGNFTEVEDEGEDGTPKTGFLIDLSHTGGTDGKWKVMADCDFTCQLVASAPLTTLELSLNPTNYEATSTVQNGRDGKTYAVRYYLDTKEDRTGEHYFLDMVETAPYTYKVPSEGSIAPTGNYRVTAVLVEKVVGDFNGNGKTTEDEYSWVTVDTKTSAGTVKYENTSKPAAPKNVTIAATGNETLTAEWDGVEKADGYRVTLYYQDGSGNWKQAGASYELDNADFTKGGAASKSGERYSLRMAPTVAGNSVTVIKNEAKPEESETSCSGGTSDEAPTNVNYKVTVEAIRYEENAINYENGGAETEKANVRYFSNPTESTKPAYLPEYTAPEITVTGDGQTVTLNGTNGYGEMVWGAIPTGTLFTVKGEVDGITVTPEQGKGSFNVSGGSGTWTVTANAAGRELIANSGRVCIVAEKGNDRTEYYLRLVLDDVPPIITVDAKNVRADMTTGAYTVTGQTEPGLEVIMDSTPALTGRADAEGRFSLSGTLPANAESETGFDSILASLTARDGAGNEAEPASVVISARPETQWDRPVEPETPSGGGGGRRGGGSSFPTIIAIRSSADAASVTDYTDGIYGLTFRSSASFASFLGVQVDGKTIHPSNYIAEEGSIVVYLKAVYLRTLRKGLHTVTILSSEGNASMNFTIGGVNSALTYDEGIGVYVCYGALSLAGMLLLRRRRIRS